MPTQKEIGVMAEALACVHLQKLGYKILETNWYYGHLELDIVAQEGDQIVIVEVKSRQGIRYEHPSEAVTNAKIKNIVEAADNYIRERELTLETRFDVITVIFFKEGHELEHFRDAFYPTM